MVESAILVLAALVVSVASVMVWTTLQTAPRPRTAHEYLGYLSELHAAQRELMAASTAYRVLVLRADGPGRAPSTPPHLVTIVGELTRGIAPRAPQWTARPADESYRAMLARVWLNGSVHLVTSRMPDSDLRRLYEADGVEDSIVIACDRSTRGGGWVLWYLSVSMSGTMNEVDHEAIERCAHRVASVGRSMG